MKDFVALYKYVIKDIHIRETEDLFSIWEQNLVAN